MGETILGDLYAVLGVARDASAGDIRGAYRRLARRHHPDLTQDPGAAARFANITRAYEVLHDPERRARYDRSAGGPSSPVDVVTTTPDPTVPARPAVRRGVLELSRGESSRVAHHPLTLRDAEGRTIVLPAGTLDGDLITVCDGSFNAVLTVRTTTRA